MTIPHRFVLLTLDLAVALTAQVPGLPQPEPPKPTLLINGVVVDQESRTPIPGARVTIASPTVATPPGSAIQLPAAFAPTVADEKGRFEVRVNVVSRLTVSASATGFGLYSAALMLTEGQTTAYVEVPLTRLGSVQGVLVDEETRKPLAGLGIEAVPRETLPMGDPGSRPDPATSRSDGSFSIANLAPAEFFLRISPEPSPTIETIPANQLTGDARDKSLEVPEGFPGYGTIYWPGADADIPRTGGLKATGGVLDAGEIRLVKRKLHNLSGVLTGCDSGASMQLLLAPPTRRDKTLDQDLTCGDGFRILNLPDGSFTLSAVQAGPPRRFAFQPIDAATRGPLTLAMSAVLPVQIEVELEGVAREKLSDDLKYLRPELQPESAPVRISTPSKLLSGAFEADLFPGLRYLLSVLPLPVKYYLKQLSYNGVPLPDVTGFTAYGGTLELIFSDHPGVLEAKIAGGNASYLFAVRDGMSYADVMNQSLGSFRQLPGPAGSAKLQGLKPGRYRTFLSPNSMPTPEAFDDYLRQAASVTIEEDQTATVSLQSP